MRSTLESTTAASAAESEYDDGEGAFTRVDRKKKRKLTTSPNGDDQRLLHDRRKPKTVKVIGKNQSSARIKASGAVISKAVFCVSNLSNEYEPDDLVAYIRDSSDITVLSCHFLSNTRFKDSKSFRVCIAKVDKDSFLDPNNWPEDVIVRSWVWKAKQPPEINNGIDG